MDDHGFINAEAVPALLESGYFKCVIDVTFSPNLCYNSKKSDHNRKIL